MLAALVDVGGIFLIGRVRVRPQDLRAHDLGEAENGVERGTQLVAHGGEEARLGEVGLLGARPRLVRDRFRLLELGDQRVLLGAELEHGDDGRVEPAHQPDEIDVHADRHGGHRPVERVVEQGEADDDGDRHRQGAGIDDGHHRGCEQHAHRDDDQHRGEDEGVRRLALRVRADEGDGRPTDAVEELGGGDLGAPHRRLAVVARRPDELPAQADEDALGDEHRAEPDQKLARRRPEHGAHGDDDGEQRRGDGGGQLVPHEHQQQLVLELRLAARFIGELLARLLHAAVGATLVIGQGVSFRPR